MIAPAIAPRDPDAVQRQPEHIRRAAVLVPANDRSVRHGGNMAQASVAVAFQRNPILYGDRS